MYASLITILTFIIYSLSFSHAGGPQLLKSQACRNGVACLMRPDALAKTYKLTPAISSGVPEYFRARRGPFTPGLYIWLTVF